MARWDLHPEVLGEIRTDPLLRDLAESVAADAKALAPERSGDLKASIHVDGVFPNAAYVAADPRNPRDEAEGHPDEAAYATYVELGTAHSTPRPFLKPALYRYREP